MLAEGLAIAIENVAAAITCLLVVRTVLAASFAVALAIVVVMVMRLDTCGGCYGASYRQRQRAEEIAPLASPPQLIPTYALLLDCICGKGSIRSP